MANQRVLSVRLSVILAIVPCLGACNLLVGKEEPKKVAPAIASALPPVFNVSTATAAPSAPSDRVAAEPSSAPTTPRSEYSLEGIGGLPSDCTDPAIVMMAVPKNYYGSDTFDWRHVRQVALANPEFEIVGSLSPSSKKQSIAFSVNEHLPTKGVALVAHCQSVATCLKFAAAYRTVVPTAKQTPICGANANIGARITGGKSVLPSTGRIADVLPDSKDAQSQCVRLAACKAARDHVLSSDETQECMKKPSSFKLRCALKKTCEEVLLCSSG